MFDGVDELAGARPARRPVGGDRRLSRLHGDRDAVRAGAAPSAFYLGGGYKYAMAGEGMAFMHCPPGFGPTAAGHRLVRRVRRSDRCRRAAGRLHQATRCASWARPSIRRRSTGSTPSGGCCAENGLTTARISRACRRPPGAAARRASPAPRSGDAELLNPLDGEPHARFLAFRIAERAALVRRADGAGTASPTCAATCCASASALYHDEEDVDALRRAGRRRWARASGRARSRRLAMFGDRVRDPRRPTRRSAGRGRRSSP